VAGPVRIVARGLVRRCARCGSGGLFPRWFKMVQRCSHCGMLFERDEGFFLGVWVMNFAAVSFVVAVVLAIVIALEANDAGANLGPILAVGGIAALVTPIVCYPFSRTLWAAIELVMRPMDIAEEAEAMLHAGDDGQHQ
jgi:hypothetical protein